MKVQYTHYVPFEVVLWATRESRTLQNLSNLFSTVTEIIDGPHVGELYDPVQEREERERDDEDYQNIS